jgi:hypothetical protein
MGILIQVEPRAARLKRDVRAHLAALGFTRTPNGGLVLPGVGKEVIRQLHLPQRTDVISRQNDLIVKSLPKLQNYFANGDEVDPARISPELEKVHSHTWQAELFRLASLSWSVPVSSGFGRRLRFLVWDRHNDKLIGIIAIGDPVFNLGVRDQFIGWTGTERKERLVNVMDAYVLGAVAPYNLLLGGKLVASLLRTSELYDEFNSTYGNLEGVISKKSKSARLLAVTTSSSMGRSSVYNRLKIHGVEYMKSIGFSGGWGHFHVPDDLFVSMRNYLRDLGHECADYHGYGQGPNWRIRVIRTAMSQLGFKGDLLKHGIRREVFISLLAKNSVELLKSGRGNPDLASLQSVAQVGDIASERWLIPRAVSRPEFRAWSRSNWRQLIYHNISVRPLAVDRNNPAR